MSSKIIVGKLVPDEFNELIDLMDFVFSKAHSPTDFMTLLPGLYHPTQECADNHWVVREQGRLVSSIGTIPSVIVMGDKRIKLEGIGGVCTNKREAGKGYMRAIMEEILEYYRRDGVMLSYLTGERKRYQRYGYEKAGMAHEFYITGKNVAECPESVKEIPLSMAQMAKDDALAISYAKGLHDRDVIHYERDVQGFYTKLIHWTNIPYIVLNGNGEYAGYFVYSKIQNRITEICAETDDLFEAIIHEWVMKNGDVSLTLSPWKMPYIKRMLRICENVNVIHFGQWLILDWENVVSGLFQAKSTYTALPDGHLNIGIDGYGTLSITVKNNDAQCIRTDQQPDITCDSLTATRLMCGHVSPQYVVDLPAVLTPLFISWFPLPLHCPNPDAV